MKNNPLSAINVLKAKFGSLLNAAGHSSVPAMRTPPKYKKIRDLTPDYSKRSNRVGLFQDAKGNKFVIKKTSYNRKDSDALFMENEATVLESLSETDGPRLSPGFKEFIKGKHGRVLVTGFAEGKQLDSYNAEIRQDVIRKTYGRLALLSERLKQKSSHTISRRRSYSYALSFPVLLIKSVLLNPRYGFFYLKVSLSFYLNYIAGRAGGTETGLAHRDLYPDNILYSPGNDSITLLDWESAVITDSLYDLSQIAMIYHADFGTERLAAFLREHLENNSQRRRFFALAAFNGMQILSREHNSTDTFRSTYEFLHTVVPVLKEVLLYKKSPFETVNTFTLNLIYVLYQVSGMKMVDTRSKILLCYHSVGNDGWRFSTRVKLFERHIEALKKHGTLLPLEPLLMGKGGGININFDDGYENVVTNALPVLKKHSVPATLFALGNSGHADRGELENDLPFMSISDMKMLKKEGWEIGFHTSTHGPVNSLNEHELSAEIENGKKSLESKLGFPLHYFAYPKGYYNDAVVRHVRNAGFAAAFTVDGKPVDTGADDLMLLDRVPVDGEISPEQLLALISPLGLRVSALYLKLLQLKEKHFGHRH